jgi:tetrahedral aminopeptidase
MKLYDLIKKLTEMPGPTGFEAGVGRFVAEEWSKCGASVKITNAGNVVAHLGGKGKKLLIDAHLDEICMLVKSISDDGYLFVTHGQGLGEIEAPPNLAYYLHRVRVGTAGGYVPGFLGAVAGHVRNKKQRLKTEVEWDDIFVDLGLASKEEVAALGIHPGCPVIFDSETRKLGKYIQGKAMDTRANLAQMIEFARTYDKASSNYDVYLSATIQEEVGMTGPWEMSASQFDLAIALEVGVSGDIPNVGMRQMPSSLGKGPLLVHKDNGVHYDERILSALDKAAQAKGLPVQHVVFYGFGSDGSVLTKRGIPAALFAFPCRYTHTGDETCSMQDLESMVSMLHQFCKSTEPVL